MGSAFSAAFIILQACHKRFAYEHTRFMFHGFDGAGIRIDQPDFEGEVERGRALHVRVLKFIAKRSGQSISSLRRWSQAEKDFFAWEALKLGFIDGIITPPPNDPDGH